jgi:hypothetical protein
MNPLSSYNLPKSVFLDRQIASLMSSAVVAFYNFRVSEEFGLKSNSEATLDSYYEFRAKARGVISNGFRDIVPVAKEDELVQSWCKRIDDYVQFLFEKNTIHGNKRLGQEDLLTPSFRLHPSEVNPATSCVR